MLGTDRTGLCTVLTGSTAKSVTSLTELTAVQCVGDRARLVSVQSPPLAGGENVIRFIAPFVYISGSTECWTD